MVKKIEVIANLAIIVTATLLCVVLVKHYFIPKAQSINAAPVTRNSESDRRPSVNAQIQPGTKLSLTGIDWSKNGQTLLLALSTTCHFCSESGPFYRQIVKERSTNTRVVAALPQSISESKNYLDGLGVSVDLVTQVPLTSAGVRATPTIILVDENGVVMDSWLVARKTTSSSGD